MISAESPSFLGLSFSTYKKSAHFIVLMESFESRKHRALLLQGSYYLEINLIQEF